MRQDNVRSIRPRRRGGRLLVAGTLAALGWSAAGPLPWSAAQVPGPELFAKQPETPEELWSAIDYLTRTGQGRQAVPFLNAFSKAQIDDNALLKLRDQYGAGSFLRLSDDPATRPFAEPLTARLADAARRRAADPQRIQRYVPALAASKDEQDYAVARLRESGPFAVPHLVAELKKFRPTSPERERLVYNAGRLDTSTTPAWIAALDSPDPGIAADAAHVLGELGDTRAIPFLTFSAASPNSAAGVKTNASLAIEKMTGKPFERQARSPVQVLDDAAEAYARHLFEMPSEQVLLWRWDESKGVPAPYLARRLDVEGIFGGRLADDALKLEPDNRRAQVVRLGFALERAVDKVGYENFPAKDQETYADALSNGPEVLGDLLRGAIATNRPTLAAVTAEALGKVADPSLPSRNGKPHPLVQALTAPGRRLQLAAAKAIVDLGPTQPFPGSSQIVPALSRYLLNQSQPRAVVVDGNPARGSEVAGSLRKLGYEAYAETSGPAAFRSATESADVELILVSHDNAPGSWTIHDVLSIFGADSRTSALPLFVYGPKDWDLRRPGLAAEYPKAKFIIHTSDPTALERQLGGRPAKLSDAERISQARQAAETLAKIAARPRSLFAPDLAAAGETISGAVGLHDVEKSVADVLADVPAPNAQRALADVILDPSRDVELRRSGASQLARSIQKFGPLVMADQEKKLADAFQSEQDVDLHTGLGNVLGALRRFSPLSQRPADATYGPDRTPVPTAVEAPAP